MGADPINPYEDDTRATQQPDKSEQARHELLRQMEINEN
jgi:hypothetical protein